LAEKPQTTDSGEKLAKLEITVRLTRSDRTHVSWRPQSNAEEAREKRDAAEIVCKSY
jgi:hypothetical protein